MPILVWLMISFPCQGYWAPIGSGGRMNLPELPSTARIGAEKCQIWVAFLCQGGVGMQNTLSLFFFAPVLKFQASIPFSYHHSEFFFGPLLLHFQGLQLYLEGRRREKQAHTTLFELEVTPPFFSLIIPSSSLTLVSPAVNPIKCILGSVFFLQFNNLYSYIFHLSFCCGRFPYLPIHCFHFYLCLFYFHSVLLFI